MLGKNNHARLLEVNRKDHYKAYKSGNRWVFACLTTLAVATGLLFSSQPAQAATTTVATTSAVTPTDTATDPSSATSGAVTSSATTSNTLISAAEPATSATTAVTATSAGSSAATKPAAAANPVAPATTDQSAAVQASAAGSNTATAAGSNHSAAAANTLPTSVAASSAASSTAATSATAATPVRAAKAAVAPATPTMVPTAATVQPTATAQPATLAGEIDDASLKALKANQPATTTAAQDPVTNELVIPSNLGDQKVTGLSGQPGDTLTVPVPTVADYTSDKAAITATVNADNTITTNATANDVPTSSAVTVKLSLFDEDDNLTKVGELTYTAAVGTDEATLKNLIQDQIPTNYVLDQISILNDALQAGDNMVNVGLKHQKQQGDLTTTRTIEYLLDPGNQLAAGVTLPAPLTQTVHYQGLLDLVTGEATLVSTTEVFAPVSTPDLPGYATYQPIAPGATFDGTPVPNVQIYYHGIYATTDVTIPSNLGDQVVRASGKTGDDLTITVPTIKHYTADKTTVQATVNPDGTITTADTVTYTAETPVTAAVGLVDVSIPNNPSVGGLSYTGYVGDTPADIQAAVLAQLPAGYDFVSLYVYGGSLQATNNIIRVSVKHQTVTATATVTREIQAVLADGDQLATGVTLPTTVTQTIHYDVLTNVATGDAVYTPKGADSDTAGDFDYFAAVTMPTLTGYTADQTEIAAVYPMITGDKPANQTLIVHYHANTITAPVTIPSNKGPQTVAGVNGKVGTTVPVTVPNVTGYTPDKTSVQATVNADGTITTTESVTYTANTVTADVTIPSNLGDQVVPAVTGQVDDTVDVTVPAIQGYTPDKPSVQATVNADGTITTTENVTYTANTVTADVTISSNLGDKTVSGVTGQVDDTVDVTVPAVQGYTPDKTSVQATVNADGTITTTEQVTYTENKKSTITINYIEQATGKVLNTLTYTGYDGDNFATQYGDEVSTAITTLASSGFVMVQPTAANPEVAAIPTVFTDVDQTGYVYLKDERAESTITINYIEQATGKLLNTLTYTGRNGDDFAAEYGDKVSAALTTLASSGFVMVQPTAANPEVAFIPAIFTDVDQTGYVYLNDKRAESTITINYIEQATGKIINTLTYTGRNGDDFAAHYGDEISAALTTLASSGFVMVQPTAANPEVAFIPAIFTDVDQTGYVYLQANQVTADLTIPSNLGNQTVVGVTGRVTEQVTVPVPDIPGYTADKETVQATVNADGTITTTDNLVYTANMVTADVTIPSNLGDQVVSNVTGQVGDTINVTVPAIKGYTPDKTSVQATVNADGTITTAEKVTYTANTVTADVTIPSNLGDQTVSGVTGQVGDTVTITVPTVLGYTPDKTSVQATVNPDGTITTTEKVNYTANTVTANVTIPSNLGDQVVSNVTGQVGDTVNVTVPDVAGYTPDKDSVQATVNADGTITTAEKVNYTANTVTADVTIPSNLGSQTVSGVTGQVGDTVTVTVPAIKGYTPDKDSIEATVNADGTIITAENVTYTANTVTTDVTIPSNLGNQTVSGVTGQVGDTVNVTVPDVAGYTPDKGSVQATVNPDGTITTAEKVNYTANTVTADVTISSNLGDQVISNVTGQVGDTVNITVPTVPGYTPDKDSVEATVNADGTITTTEKVNYTANTVTADVTIPSNLGDQVVSNVTGQVGDTVSITVPTVPGYTPDKTSVQATVNPDGTITTAEKVNYTANIVTADVTIPSNLGDQVVSNVIGQVGTTITVTVPIVAGYTADKPSVQATVNADGTITTTENVTYTANTVTGDVTIPSNLGDQVVSNVTGQVGATITVTVPTVAGYTADKTSVPATVNADGTITTTVTVTYTAKPVTGDVTIPSNLGDQTVPEVTGQVGQQVTVPVPTVPGYTSDQATVTAVVNANGTLTTTDKVTYQPVQAVPAGNTALAQPQVTATAKAATTLPQTSEHVNAWLTTAGLTLLGLASVLGLTAWQPRRRQ